MKRLLTRALLAGLIAQAGSVLWASGPGTTSADILKIPVGSRAVGMGEAYVAQADDVSSLYWNPAGLALMQQRQASFTYTQLVKDLKYQNGGIGIPLENGAIGANLSYLSYGHIEGFDQGGNATGDVSAYSGVATIGAAWLGSQWSAGANVKGIQEKLADEKASTFGFDLGGDVIVPRPVLDGTVRVGAVVSNLGQGLKFLQQRDPLPTQWKVGIAGVQMLNRHLNLAVDYGKPRDDKSTISGGAEYWFGKFLALRTGYAATHTEGSGIRAGIGLRVKDISFDYAYAGLGELGMTHRYELSFKFGEPRPILTAEERKILQQAKAAMRNERYEQATLLFDSLIEMEPHYKPARRHIKVAMAKLENQQGQMVARQGQKFNPDMANNISHAKQTPADLDDLQQLLELGAAKSAQKPAAAETTEGR